MIEVFSEDWGFTEALVVHVSEGSPTDGLVDVRFLGTASPGLLVIPRGVWHAVRNVGDDELTFVNLPTEAYDHADPDKHRLPADNDLIPYRP